MYLIFDDEIHEICGTALKPKTLILKQYLRVLSFVDPPAPKVTEKNSGLNLLMLWLLALV